MRKTLLAISISLALFAAGEYWLRQHLFTYTSYSNSESIDRQLRDRDARADWNMLFIGDSETHWGVNPAEIDAAFERHGLAVKSFNHAFDGFGASWWARILPSLLESPALKNVKTVVVGIQMTDSYRVVSATGEDCGALQKPVLTSPFAKDLGVDSLCRSPSWDANLGKKLSSGLWTIRYSSAVRSLLMPHFMNGVGELKFNSRKDGEPYRGFEPHRSIAEDRDTYAQEFARWKAQYNADRDFVPLPPHVWVELTSPAGFFDTLNGIVRDSGRQLVLFALPTNPAVIDTFHRRADYQRNAELLHQWATERGIVFLDFGIQDVDDADVYFSDMRHLSGLGAKTFSKKLGDALANENPLSETRANAQ